MASVTGCLFRIIPSVFRSIIRGIWKLIKLTVKNISWLDGIGCGVALFLLCYLQWDVQLIWSVIFGVVAIVGLLIASHTKIGYLIVGIPMSFVWGIGLGIVGYLCSKSLDYPIDIIIALAVFGIITIIDLVLHIYQWRKKYPKTKNTQKTVRKKDNNSNKKTKEKTKQKNRRKRQQKKKKDKEPETLTNDNLTYGEKKYEDILEPKDSSFFKVQNTFFCPQCGCKLKSKDAKCPACGEYEKNGWRIFDGDKKG